MTLNELNEIRRQAQQLEREAGIAEQVARDADATEFGETFAGTYSTLALYDREGRLRDAISAAINLCSADLLRMVAAKQNALARECRLAAAAKRAVIAAAIGDEGESA